jgi:hypothetical protein
MIVDSFDTSAERDNEGEFDLGQCCICVDFANDTL